MTVATGFDVDYYLDQVGADYYLTAAGEPPGIWAGQGAAALGLRGQAGGDTTSAKTMRALFHYDAVKMTFKGDTNSLSYDSTATTPGKVVDSATDSYLGGSLQIGYAF